jgi:hypothetical protein
MSGVLLGASRCSLAGEPRIAVSIGEPKCFSTQLERKRNPLLFSSANNAAIFETHCAARLCAHAALSKQAILTPGFSVTVFPPSS